MNNSNKPSTGSRTSIPEEEEFITTYEESGCDALLHKVGNLLHGNSPQTILPALETLIGSVIHQASKSMPDPEAWIEAATAMHHKNLKETLQCLKNQHPT